MELSQIEEVIRDAKKATRWPLDDFDQTMEQEVVAE